jgi:hypothetical protein
MEKNLGVNRSVHLAHGYLRRRQGAAQNSFKAYLSSSR